MFYLQCVTIWIVGKLSAFIKSRPYLIWYVMERSALDQDSIVEHTLNYGDWSDVQEMIKILGLEKTAAIFRRQIDFRRCNYHPSTRNYFTRYFNKYAG